MKKLLVILTLFLFIGISYAVAQDKVAVKKESSYNTEMKDGQFYEYKYVFSDTITGKTYTKLNGDKLPVFKNKSGKLYVWETSKAGKKYRKYLSVKPSK